MVIKLVIYKLMVVKLMVVDYKPMVKTWVDVGLKLSRVEYLHQYLR